MKIRFSELKIEQIEIYKVPGITLESRSGVTWIPWNPVSNFTWIPGIHVYLVSIQSGFHGIQVNFHVSFFSSGKIQVNRVIFHLWCGEGLETKISI